jgi:hypothetical protein
LLDKYLEDNLFVPWSSPPYKFVTEFCIET